MRCPGEASFEVNTEQRHPGSGVAIFSDPLVGTKIESSKTDRRSNNAKPEAQSANPSQALPAPKSVQTSAPKIKTQPNTVTSDGPSTSKNAGNKNLTPNKLVYQNQRTALRLIKNIGQIKESERTDRQRTLGHERLGCT